MNIEEYRIYCLSKPHTRESFPFDENTLVYKVAGKMFTLTSIDDFKRINVKCDPIEAIRLRSEYDGVIPAWHMNKKHWNTIILSGFTNQQIYKWIDDSYELVIANLSITIKKRLLAQL
ncbi:MAG: MmcQ/YjbR family DNA-binding protein [Bacteroidota bacterium]